MRTIVFLALLASLLHNRAEAGAEDLLGSKEKFYTPHMGAQVPPELTFRDSTGKKVKLGDYGGDKPVILVLAYFRCPRLCTLVLNDLVSGLRGVPFQAGKDFEVVVVSFDPREKPELAAAKKRAYVDDYGRPGAEAGWHFLTGEQPEIDGLMNAVGFRAVWDEKGQQFAHARGILFLTPGGKIARYFLQGHYPPRDLRLALVESSEGHISAPMDRVLLMCFSYDPSTARYSAGVLQLMRLGGILTVVLVLAFWMVAWRRGRKQKLGVAG
jgi:protein SCO1/2